MAAKRKLLLKALNNRAGLRLRVFTTRVEAFGCELLRINGSHHIFARRNVREIVDAQPTKDGKAEEYQVRQFLRRVERDGLTIEE